MTTLLLSGERFQVWKVGDTIYIHTNGRCVGVDPAQAKIFVEGISAVLSGEYDRALTPDQQEQEQEQERTPEPSRSERPSVPRSRAVPTLEDI